MDLTQLEQTLVLIKPDALKNSVTGFILSQLSEYHTGYRAYSASVMRSIDYHANSDDFIFDNEAISKIFMAGHQIGEISCPTSYFEEASSIGLARSVRYGLGVLRVSLQHLLHRLGITTIRRYAGRTHDS